ncbi:glycosyltransferase [Acinetobacter sp. YH12085]|uniref:glycosyltransferase family protein n=1 Tax=Acinetobacter sp. YH12085 TaxID=2601077 RepID=UPI0015D44E12|nr:glycosyltransferase [Acinetobacter sp. YH12085]
MKILHINNFAFKKSGAEFYNTDRKISAGLILNGHHVYDFSFNDMAHWGTIWRTKKIGKKWANQEVLKIVENFKPDLILIGHIYLLDMEILKKIRKMLPQVKMATWYVDWICMEKKADFLKTISPLMECVFVTTGGDMLKEIGRNNTVAYLPNMCLNSIEHLKNFEKKDLKYDFIFCGSSSDPERTKFIQSLQNNLSNVTSIFCGFNGEAKVYGTEYFNKLSQARMGLNYSRTNDISLYTSDRIAQLTGNGLLTFTPKVPDFELLFSDKEVVYFNNVNDLSEKINYFSKHPNESFKIAQAGWEKVHSSYNARRVTKFMLETIFMEDYSEDYEWIDHVFKC